MCSISAPNENSRRMRKDVTKLIERNHQVDLINGISDFSVVFHGPKGSLYENGVWRIHVHLPDKYPFKSPSIGFMNKIYHPNIDESSGSICLDAINQNWTAMYDLVNVFESLIPQLLLYPNPQDPLNGEAANLLLSNAADYQRTVREHVRKHASALTPTAAPAAKLHPLTAVRSPFSSASTSSASASSSSSNAALRSRTVSSCEDRLFAASSSSSKQCTTASRSNSFCLADCDSKRDGESSSEQKDASRKRKWQVAESVSDSDSDDESNISSLSSTSDVEDSTEPIGAKQARNGEEYDSLQASATN